MEFCCPGQAVGQGEGFGGAVGVEDQGGGLTALVGLEEVVESHQLGARKTFGDVDDDPRIHLGGVSAFTGFTPGVGRRRSVTPGV